MNELHQSHCPVPRAVRRGESAACQCTPIRPVVPFDLTLADVRNAHASLALLADKMQNDQLPGDAVLDQLWSVRDSLEGVLLRHSVNSAVGQCEASGCNRVYDKENEVLGGPSGRCGFCSQECKDEAEADAAAAREDFRRDAACGDHGPPDSDPLDTEPAAY